MLDSTCYAAHMSFGEPKQTWVAMATFVLALISILSAFGFIIAEAYVRWSLNQNFTFLGGNVLEVLLVVGFGALAGLLLVRTRN